MSSALEIVAQYKADIESELERHLPRSGEPKEFYASVWDLLDRGGKRFRPALTFLACECVGGQRERALAAAASVELLHNMTLIHDDIEDESELRRGRPCIHRIYGIPTAINAGDAMLIKVFEIANSSTIQENQRYRLVSQIAKRAYEITRGQAFEFSMWKTKQFSEDEVIKLLRLKTGALTRLSLETGAISGGATELQLEALGEFGESVGIAFQVVDDILNIQGKVKEYGKEIGGDIREGKKTILAAHMLSVANPADRRKFLKLLGDKRISRTGLRQAIGLYQKYGSIEHAKTLADGYLKKSIKAIGVLPASKARSDLATIAEFLVSRSF
jgi:geranylgeranyl diphosphate synthase type I